MSPQSFLIEISTSTINIVSSAAQGIVFLLFGITFMVVFSKNGPRLGRSTRRRERTGMLFGLLFLMLGVIMSSYGNVILFDTPNKIASKDMDALIYMTATTAYIAPVGSALTVFGIAFLMMFARRGPVQRTQQNI